MSVGRVEDALIKCSVVRIMCGSPLCMLRIVVSRCIFLVWTRFRFAEFPFATKKKPKFNAFQSFVSLGSLSSPRWLFPAMLCNKSYNLRFRFINNPIATRHRISLPGLATAALRSKNRSFRGSMKTKTERTKKKRTKFEFAFQICSFF